MAGGGWGAPAVLVEVWTRTAVLKSHGSTRENYVWAHMRPSNSLPDVYPRENIAESIMGHVQVCLLHYSLCLGSWRQAGHSSLEERGEAVMVFS